MTDVKTKPTDQNIEHFLNDIPDPQKREDSFALVKLMQQITGLEPILWGTSIIGFGSYHYKYASGHEGDSFLVGFSPRKLNLTLYIMPGFEAYNDLLQKLGKHKIGKSCLYIKRLADVDMPTLKLLVEKSVQYMRQAYP